MVIDTPDLPLNGKKLYFASDFHLGAPDPETSKIRERKIIRWLDSIEDDAAAIFLVGDIFDFWFEYGQVIPKGFIPFIAKISHKKENRNTPIPQLGNLGDEGNKTLWQELGIPVYHHPIEFSTGGKKILVGHGDGLGPGDRFYKLLKKVFTNPVAQGLFRWIHPDLGIRLAKGWSGQSRISNTAKNENHFLGEGEWLWQYCKQVESNSHHDFYIFGHRHLPLELAVSENSTYYNLGEWVTQFHYLVYDGSEAKLLKFET